MKDFLTDEEMAELEGPEEEVMAVPPGKAAENFPLATKEEKWQPDFLSDEEMAFQEKLEKEAKKTEDLKSGNYNEFESGLKGLQQGVTFGYADEIGAGIRSLGSDKTYDQLLQDIRAEYAKAEQQNPASFLTGDIAGGLISGVALGAAGGALKGAQAATKVGGALTGAKQLSTAGKVGQAALAGAGSGALEMSGRTEEDFGSVGYFKDVATGAALGGVTSGALSAVGAGTKAIIGKGKKSLDSISPDSLRRNLVAPANKKQRQLDLDRPEIIEKAFKTAKELNVFGKTTKQTLDNLDQVKNNIGEELDDIIDTYDRAYGRLVDVDDQIDLFRDSLKRAKQAVIKDDKIGKLSKAEAVRATKYLEENFEKVFERAKETGKFAQSVRDIKSSLGQKLKTDDFINAGDKGPKKQEVLRAYRILSETEDEVLEEYRKAIEMADLSVITDGARVKQEALVDLDNIVTMKEDYSALKDFEDFFRENISKGGSSWGEGFSFTSPESLGTAAGASVGSAVAGTTGGAIGGIVGGVGGKMLKKWSSTPNGKLLISNALEKGVENIPLKKLPSTIRKVIEKANIPTQSGSISVKTLNEITGGELY